MTKTELVERIYQQVGLSKKDSAQLVESVFETIKGTLARGEQVKISGFGKFAVREKGPRSGRNPQTGQAILIEARRVVTFRPSRALNVPLNDGDAPRAGG
jgi:integration host factor subunit alpha